MYAEFTFTEESRNIQVVMDASIQRENGDLRNLLRLYLDDKLDPVIRDRVESILRNNKLVSKGAATSDGDKLLSTGMLSVREYGQYQLTSLENDFTNNNEVFISLLRERPSGTEGSKQSGLKVRSDLYDRDQKKMVSVEGKCSRIKENRPIPADFKVIINDEDVKCEAISKFDDSTVKTDIETKLDVNHILEGCISNYSIPRKSILVDDISVLDEEQKASLFASFSNEDIGDMVSTTVFDRPFKSFHAEYVPLSASDIHVAEQWISELRKYWWANEFVDAKRAKFDQEYWSERLTGKKNKNLVISDEGLLEELYDSDAYWGVASMMDLMPDSEYRMQFFVSPNTDYNEDIRNNIFSETNTANLKKIIAVDPYPGRDSEKILRRWADDKTCKIVFLANKSRYESGGNLLEKGDLSENAELILDNRVKGEAHSRYLILENDDKELMIWNMDCSLGQFKMMGNKIINTTKALFTPHPFFYDKELEKIVKGLEKRRGD